MAVFVFGTITIFNQTSAPTGWTKLTTTNDAAFRVVSGAISSGGSVNFSTVHQTNIWQGTAGTDAATGAFAISATEMGTHTHPYRHTTNSPLTPATPYRTATPGGAPLRITPNNTGSTLTTSADPASGGQSHLHPFPVSLSLSGSSFDFSVKYVDVILASKS